VSYEAFLASKALAVPARGFASVPTLAEHLFPFQREAVAFGLRAGSWGCFFDTGLGKTACELEWAAHAAEASNGRALILTPLAVAQQIAREAARFHYPQARVIRSADDVGPGLNICNYDRLHLLDPAAFGAVALDEASILKSFTGATSRGLIEAFASQRFRMAATATPAPNDHTELAQHAAFLGVLTREEMLVRWFINDGGDTKAWRLKGHAVEPFFDWMASWARMAEHPRDLGDDLPGFDLPPMDVIRHQVDDGVPPDGALFSGLEAVTATTLHDVKRRTAVARAARAVDLVNTDDGEPWVIWCDTDYEADAMLDAFDAVAGGAEFFVTEVRGSHPIDRKEDALAAFADGTKRVLVSKPSVCGWGLNWQHCARMVFLGRSFSYEAFYQAVRRCWRFGQQRPVQVHLIVAEGEDAIGRVLDRKAADHAAIKAAMVAAMQRAVGQASKRRTAYTPTHAGRLPAWLGVSA